MHLRMWLRPFLVLGFVLSFGGCASEDDADWYADRRFTSAEREGILRGAAWISARVGRPAPRISFDYEFTGEPVPNTIIRESVDDRFPDALVDLGAVGLCSGSTGPKHFIVLDFTLFWADPAILAAHELGHCELGLADDHSSVGIMRWSGVDALSWTPLEDQQCRSNPSCLGNADGTATETASR